LTNLTSVSWMLWEIIILIALVVVALVVWRFGSSERVQSWMNPTSKSHESKSVDDREDTPKGDVRRAKRTKDERSELDQAELQEKRQQLDDLMDRDAERQEKIQENVQDTFDMAAQRTVRARAIMADRNSTKPLPIDEYWMHHNALQESISEIQMLERWYGWESLSDWTQSDAEAFCMAIVKQQRKVQDAITRRSIPESRLSDNRSSTPQDKSASRARTVNNSASTPNQAKNDTQQYTSTRSLSDNYSSDPFASPSDYVFDS